MSVNIKKKCYAIQLETQSDGVFRVKLNHPQEGMFFSFPVGVFFTYNGITTNIVFSDVSVAGEDRLEFHARKPTEEIAAAVLAMELKEDDIVMSFSVEAAQPIRVESVELLRVGRFGLYMVDCINYFAPVPRNYNGINRAFYRSFCDCSIDGYFSPPPLNFSIGNRFGWISFGLLDLPNSAEYKLSPDLGILVEKPEGHLLTAAGCNYAAPRLMLTFPENEWQGEVVFREKLLEKGMIEDYSVQKESFPQWWQKPLIVTYGDQILELQYNFYTDADWGAPGFTQQWLEDWLENAEKTLGQPDFTVVVDAFWQHRWSPEPKPDVSRFPNLRGFIDECHRRGHKVLLWTAPFLDNPDNGFVPLSEQMGVLSKDTKQMFASTLRYLDFTADGIEAYLDRIARGFFGNGEGELDCDGLKMDFLASIHPVKDCNPQHPELGLGMRNLYRFYDLFDQAARKVKPDVLLNGSACDPRFDKVLHMNRLHDIQRVYEERELRARASVLAAPGILVDSDGAIMLSDWVEESYLNAVIYSTPALYYVRKFHDGRSLPDGKMKALGRLLELSGHKPWGDVVFISPNNWRLYRNGATVGAAFDGHTLLLQDKNEKELHLFSWREGIQTLPLFGLIPASVPEGFSVENGSLTGNLREGEVYTFPLKQG